MDYSKLSDAEINKLVALAKGAYEVAECLFVDDVRRYQFHPPKNKGEQKFFFDPCNNPADAWPIITANKISIYAMSEADKRGGWGAEAFHPNDAYSFNDNPLRAAMTVFLMMQEG